jgi:hypothetical protein
MTEHELQALGFERESDNADSAHVYHYYSLQLAMGFGFISCASDAIGNDGQWYVEFFDSYPTIRFTDFGELQSLINLIKSRIVQDESAR